MLRQQLYWIYLYFEKSNKIWSSRMVWLTYYRNDQNNSVANSDSVANIVFNANLLTSLAEGW